MPTLVTCGRYDEIIAGCSETITRGIAGARMHVFEQSAHCAHLEEPESYAALVEEFLALGINQPLGESASSASGRCERR